MVKNYLVSAVRPVTSGWHMEKNQDLYENYQKMYDISLASFRKFVSEPFEAICWQEPVRDNEEYTVKNWQEIRDLWHQEPCNIFWAGADTIMLRPTSIFGDRFKEYRLFNYTDPRRCRDFADYYNNDLQYFPYTMPESVWSLGDDLWKHLEGHPQRNWGFDQLRNNHMFWSQDIPDDDRCHPELAYQCLGRPPNMITDQWNGIRADQAHIWHFHGSRSSGLILSIMQHLAKELQL